MVEELSLHINRALSYLSSIESKANSIIKEIDDYVSLHGEELVENIFNKSLVREGGGVMVSKPLSKEFALNNDCNYLLSSYKTTTEIPVGKHLGAFGAIRKNHIHEGVDLYCEAGDTVFSMFRGTVVNILPFTGAIADSPWWNNTYCVLVNHGDFVLNYGEVIPSNNIKIGDFVEAGDVIGFVERVLKKDKGRPTSMLHLEKYVAGSTNVVYTGGVWGLGDEKPEGLLDPTSILIDLLHT